MHRYSFCPRGSCFVGVATWPRVRIGRDISSFPSFRVPIALYPATSEREKISFHQLNKETGNRIRYRKVDAETGDDVEQANHQRL